MTIERCKKCILPHSVSPVNDEGLCEQCATYENTTDWPALEGEFKGIVADLKAKGRKHDCMVTLTGGKDSSFVLHYMKNICDSNPLAFTWDNGLIREESWRNIHSALAKTGLDHEIVKFDPELWQRTLRATFRQYQRSCWCPIFVMATAIPVAVKNKVPAIITGFSEGQRELDHTFQIPEATSHLESIKHFYDVWSNVFADAVKAQEDPETAEKIMEQLFGPLKECLETYTDPADYPAIIPLANYTLWMEREKLEATLAESIGWQRPCDTFVHSSCIIEPVKGYLEFKGGMSEIYHELSNIVRGGYMTRDAAMYDISTMNLCDEEPQELDHFLRFIDIDKDEFSQIVKDGPKHKFLVQGVADGRIAGPTIAKTVAWIYGTRQQKVNYSPVAKKKSEAVA
ncbi:MAG: hypothetical protein ABFR97_09345 [Thermodesulfobacteriota bacterium]